MPSLKVAHVNEQGQNMVIVPLDPSFDYKSSSEQDGIMGELQGRARSAGLAGSVAVVWERGGRMHFRAPRPWHPFFQSLGMHDVLRSVNKTLSW